MAHNFPDDAYHWRAEYADGTHLDEHSAEGGLPFAAIDQGRLVGLRLLPNYRHLGEHFLQLEPGQRLIFHRVRSLRVPLAAEVPMTRTSVTVLGWQATVGGANVKVLWKFGDDGHIEVESPDGTTVVTE